MTELIIVLDNTARLNDLNELDTEIRGFYKDYIKYSHINHLSSASEYVYGLSEGALVKSKPLLPILRYEFAVEFFIII